MTPRTSTQNRVLVQCAFGFVVFAVAVVLYLQVCEKINKLQFFWATMYQLKNDIIPYNTTFPMKIGRQFYSQFCPDTGSEDLRNVT